MSKKVLFGFDYTNNEFVKIILYLFVGGSAALIEWAFFYVFSEAAGINYLASRRALIFYLPCTIILCAIFWCLQAACAMAKPKK